jgi:hypothetical protein
MKLPFWLQLIVIAAWSASIAAVVSSVLQATGAAASVVIAFIGWMLTTAGWFASARLSSISQERMFLHNVINAARLELVAEIRREQDWIQNVNGLAGKYQGAVLVRKYAPGNQQHPSVESRFWLDQNRIGRETLFAQRRAKLTIALEEYELLFPATPRVRGQLAIFTREQVLEVYAPLLNDLMRGGAASTAAIEKMDARQDANSDYAAILEDLRVHVHNVSLSEITGRRLPARVPLDPTVPLLVMRSDGLLDVVANGKSWRSGEDYLADVLAKNPHLKPKD